MDKKKSIKLKVATVVMMSSTALALCLTAGCGHAFTDSWTYDETNHWHACLEPDCEEKLNEGAHVDENEDGKCDVCQYVLKTVEETKHQHAYDGDWQKSDAKHWKECTADGCTDPKEKSQEGVHVYDNDSDTTCNTCGYVREVGGEENQHRHAYDGEWINTDANKHWKECTAEGCTDPKAKSEEGVHDYTDDSDTTCNTCGHVREVGGEENQHQHAYDGEWISTDANKHWKECTAEGCTDPKAKSEEGVHVYDNDNDTTCNTCGHVREVGGGEEELPQITTWGTVADPIYGEVHENDTDYLYHHLFYQGSENDDYDSFEVTVKLDGVDGTIVAQQPLNDNDINNHTYHLHIRIIGTRYQTAVFTIKFKKDGEVKAIGTYTRAGDKEVVLDQTIVSVSKGSTETISILKINGSTDLTGKTIAWTIADTEGTGVASIPENSNGNSVVVSALAAGKATLTCTIGTGNDAFSTTCNITVVEGEVVITVVDVSGQMKFNNKFQTAKEAIQLRCELQGAEYVELVQQIDPSLTTVVVTMDGQESISNIIRKEWQAPDVYNLWLQIEVESNWDHDYEFAFSFKNTKGDVVATAAYQEIAPKALNLDKSTLNLTLADGQTVSETITSTKTSKVEGDVVWTIDDTSVATIVDNKDGTVTVTAVAKGKATITATVDGLEKTCEVNVLEEGEEVTVPTVTVARIHEVYGGDVHCGVVLDGTDELASKYAEVASKFAYVKVNGVKNNDMKDMFAFGADGSYRVNVYMGGTVQKGVDYVFEICDADGNVLLKTVALQWN